VREWERERERERLLPVEECGNDPGALWVSLRFLFFPVEFPLNLFFFSSESTKNNL